jgi:hypothetical protein
MSELRVNAFWKFNAGQETAGNALHGEPRKVRGAPQRAGRGNGRDRGWSAAPQVRDLRRLLALSLPFPD